MRPAGGVQADARNIRASDRRGGLGVSVVRRQYFTEVEVRLRANLYYHRTTTFTVRFDLVGAAWQRVWLWNERTKTYVADYERYRADGEIELLIGVQAT